MSLSSFPQAVSSQSHKYFFSFPKRLLTCLTLFVLLFIFFFHDLNTQITQETSHLGSTYGSRPTSSVCEPSLLFSYLDFTQCDSNSEGNRFYMDFKKFPEHCKLIIEKVGCDCQMISLEQVKKG